MAGEGGRPSCPSLFLLTFAHVFWPPLMEACRAVRLRRDLASVHRAPSAGRRCAGWAAIREEGLVRNKAVYVALGVTPEGTKDILGLWIETSEGAKFWLRVMNELKNRGVNDILIAVGDGLKGFPDAINAVFPQTIVQTCVVHLIRNSMDFASWKDRKTIAAELKKNPSGERRRRGQKGARRIRRFSWGKKYPAR